VLEGFIGVWVVAGVRPLKLAADVRPLSDQVQAAKPEKRLRNACCVPSSGSSVATALSRHCGPLCLLAGYLEKEAGNALLSLLASSSAAGSHIIMTAPPTPAENALGHEAAAEAAAGGSASSAEASKDPRVKLHHSTFEDPTETLAR
jgi:hypothetical protein